MKWRESARELDTSARCEVLVAGGGIAGIAAALAAARGGAKVLLVEKEWMLGGLATAGLITIYLPLCDGNGRQVVFGIGEELLRLSIRYGAEEEHFPLPAPWLSGRSPDAKREMRYQVQYHPYLFALCAEALLQEAGVEILYGTSICSVIMEGRQIRAAVIENKSGRSAIALNAVVDATGDADVCLLSGAPTHPFGPGNALASWHYFYSQGQVQLRMAGAADIVTGAGANADEEREGFSAGERVLLRGRRFTGLDGRELSEMMQFSHKALLACVDSERKVRADYVPVSIPVIPQVRMTRRVQGEYTQDDSETFVRHGDSIGLTGNWRKAGPVYELPYRTLYSKAVGNLICAGRCISVTDAMWDITRVIPPCAVTGQAAGTASALAVKNHGAGAAANVDFSQVDVKLLQLQLAKDGVLLHTDEIDLWNKP